MEGSSGFARAGIDGTTSARIAGLDVARGVAILAMIAFHFVRDLELFGIVAPGTTLTGGWAIAARLIAGSFLFLSGVSLALAHGRGIRWRAFLRRVGVLAVAAALVTGASYLAMPDRFIYFGILHAILLGSLIGVLFAPRPATLSVLAAGAILLLWWGFGRALDLPGWLDWTGLATSPRPALDQIPALPWLAPVFIGLASAKIVQSLPSPGWHPPALIWLGRHSLLVYLVHQPLLIAAIWIVIRLLPS
ncbi:heparan-alpha-glucosaminide N-acetyltransferase [Roseivivax lentus]|uniref:heparan-alpha-glucosaminide N-acetyltransferase n=1 Tax=Roseivivax lentus TaxID=633194 RepID=UPI001F3763E5|nr:heparan-alpha-glucosaminide N-acetyltransferase [Roseivivax lentus]